MRRRLEDIYRTNKQGVVERCCVDCEAWKPQRTHFRGDNSYCIDCGIARGGKTIPHAPKRESTGMPAAQVAKMKVAMDDLDAVWPDRWGFEYE